MSETGATGLTSVQLQPGPPLWCVVVYEPGGGPSVAVHGPYTDVRLAMRDAMVRNTQRTRPPGTLLAALARLEPPTH